MIKKSLTFILIVLGWSVSSHAGMTLEQALIASHRSRLTIVNEYHSERQEPFFKLDNVPDSLISGSLGELCHKIYTNRLQIFPGILGDELKHTTMEDFIGFNELGFAFIDAHLRNKNFTYSLKVDWVAGKILQTHFLSTPGNELVSLSADGISSLGDALDWVAKTLNPNWRL